MSSALRDVRQGRVLKVGLVRVKGQFLINERTAETFIAKDKLN